MEESDIIRKIQGIAAKISESEKDERTCTLLLDLRPVIESEHVPATRAIIFSELWKHKLPQQIVTFVRDKQNYFNNSWLYACHLCSLAVDSCIGCTDENFPQQTFVPDLTVVLMQTVSKMGSICTKSEKSAQSGLLGNISWMIMILGKLAENFISTSCSMLGSKYMMQLLMIEEPSLSLIALSFLKTLLKCNANIFYQVSESRTHSIVEELTFKLIGTTDDNNAKVSLSVLILMLEMHPLLLDLFSTKRYRGFKTYVLKLQGKGFDGEIHKLSCMLDSQTKHLHASQKEMNAAIVIQACYKGYKLRQKLQKATLAIANFQRIYRNKMKKKCETKTQGDLERMKVEYDESERRKTFMNSKVKQLKTIESIPAKTVNTFLQNLEHESATKIQAAWVGYKSRKNLEELKPALVKSKAIVVIQRQVRKWLKRCRDKRDAGLLGLLPPGLDDQRKCELQQVIGNIRNRFPVKCKTDAEFEDLHEMAFRRLNHHMMGLHEMRREDERRKGLLAQLSVLSNQLMYAPTDLDKVTSSDVDHLASHSGPIIVAARRQHQECMNEERCTWWKKYRSEVPLSIDKGGGDLSEQKQF